MNSTGDAVEFVRYFYANVTNKSFYETPFGIFYRANNLLASSLGLIAICLLFYMIRFKTPPSFRPYSKLLYLSLAMDLYCVPILALNQLVCSYKYIIVLGGVGSLLNKSSQCYLQIICTLVPQIQMLLLPIFALYRHKHIKNKIAPDTNQLLTCCFVAAIPLVPSVITSSHSECTNQKITTDILLSWYVETPLPEVFIVIDFKTDQYAKIGFLHRKLVSYGCCLLTICIAVASVRLLRREWPKLNKKAKLLKKRSRKSSSSNPWFHLFQ
ncbi:hypothetical protein M3Y96_01038100 [Aphelenchoides besseyi]|nr:hypothetical protein M3Y96_01038100 [Aphelenchoides besseyi]